MKIRYLGHASFEITSNSGVKVITDPYTKVGYELPKGLTADILTTSHSHFDHNYIQAVKAANVVCEEGNYHIDGIEICGIPSFHDTKKGALRGKNIIYIIKMDGVSICHMGDIGEDCSDALIEKIGCVDVLLIPIGGTYTIDGVEAKKYIDCLQPKVVIPMHYKPSDGALDIAEIQSFTTLYSPEKIVTVEDGTLELTEQTNGIIYMQRVKKHE